MILAAAAAAYHNTFGVPFLFDDQPSIVENPTIRRVGWEAFSPPVGNGYTVGGRPLLNFSFALNHAVSGVEVWSYHALNLLIHGLAALALFGVVRRTLERLPSVTGQQTRWIPLSVSLLWVVHPLQTQSVTYVVQRAESLVSLFYLLTLYCFIRSVAATAGRRWSILSLAACALGMMTKEVMATAPLVVLLYDRVFVAGTFRAAWRARPQYYLGLFGTWLVLAWLVIGTGGRGGSVGASEEVSPWTYALTQAAAIVHYLRLAIWPDPLIFDYGTEVVRSFRQVWGHVALLGLLAAVLARASRRHAAIGFLGASFALILLPSSSVVPIATQTVSEHRMYLAVAPVLVMAVLAWQRWLGPKSVYLVGILAVVLGGLTIRRNADYRSEYEIWRDTAEKRPGNARAQGAHGKNLFLQGKYSEALTALEQAVRLAPDSDADHYYNLALTLERLNRRPEALENFRAAARLRPNDFESWNQIGLGLASVGRHAEAIASFQESLRIKPAQAQVHFQMGEAWFSQRNFPAAAASYAEAVRLNPTDAATHHYHGLALALSGRTAEAVAEFEQALRLRPDYSEANQALSRARAELSRGSR